MIDDAAASAVLRVLAVTDGPNDIVDPLGYAATAGRNSALSLLRSERRFASARMAFGVAAAPTHPIDIPRCTAEVVLQVADVASLASACADASGSAELRAVAVALRQFEAGNFEPPKAEAARRRLSRGVNRLAEIIQGDAAPGTSRRAPRRSSETSRSEGA